MLNSLKGWRTVLVNVLLAIMPILEAAEFADVLPELWLPWYALGVVIANVILRGMTTTPIGKGN